MQTLNTKLLIAYKSKDWRAYELAKKAGIETTRFCRIVTGKLAARPDEKRILSKILRIAQKDLF